MIQPKYLRKGDTIAIVAPAGKVSKDAVLPGIELLQKQGYNVIMGNHVFDEYGVFAGSDEQRIYDLQKVLDDPSIDAILCARGGYGTMRILQRINWSNFLKNPKWLVGFSDITVLHCFLNHQQIASIHGAMPARFISNNKVSSNFTSAINALGGVTNNYDVTPNILNRTGLIDAEIVGGNLSIIYSCQSTPFEIDTRNKILFIEDLTEYHYHLDRIMLNLKLSGKLSQLKGLIVGDFSEMKDGETPFGKSAYEIIAEHVAEYNFPVCFGFSAGHCTVNNALVLGKNTQLWVKEDKVLIKN